MTIERPILADRGGSGRGSSDTYGVASELGRTLAQSVDERHHRARGRFNHVCLTPIPHPARAIMAMQADDARTIMYHLPLS
jgi:hypothetical protein